MFKMMLVPSILIVWATLPSLAEPSPQHIPEVLPKPEGLSLAEYLQQRMDAQPQGQLHQRHTLLTPSELASDFRNWSKDSKDSKKSTSVERVALQAPDNPTTPAAPAPEPPSSTAAPAPPPTPKKPLSHAIYSSSLDAMAINKNSKAAASSSRNVFSRRRYTDAAFHLGPDSNKWTPVTAGDALTTNRRRGGADRSQDFSFEGGGGGLDPSHMNKKRAYTQTDTFRQKHASVEHKLEPFSHEEVINRRPRLTTSQKPSSKNIRRNKHRQNPHARDSVKLASVGPPGHIPHASPELRWSDGSLVEDKSKFLLNPTSKFTVSTSPDEVSHNGDPNNYSFLGSPEVEGYYLNDGDKMKYSHEALSKIPFSFEVVAPRSQELPNFPYIRAGNIQNHKDGDPHEENRDTFLEISTHGSEKPSQEDDLFRSKGKSSVEDGPYRYKTTFMERPKEKEKYRTTTPESPHHSYDKNSKPEEETNMFDEKKTFDTPIYRSKINGKINNYRYRFELKSRDTDKPDGGQGFDGGALFTPVLRWSSERIKFRQNEPTSNETISSNYNPYQDQITTEKSVFEPSPIESIERRLSAESRRDDSKADQRHHDGYILADHFPKGHKSPERGSSVGSKNTSKSPERDFQPSYRYQSHEMYTGKEPSKVDPPRKFRPRSRGNETHKWSSDPSSRSKEATPQRKRFKVRSRKQRKESRDSLKDSLDTSKRPRAPASHRSQERKPTTEILDEYAVHHIAGPPYHDSIPVDVVKTLEKEGGPSYIPKTAIVKQDVDSYEVVVDKYLDGDDVFHFEEDIFTDSPQFGKSSEEHSFHDPSPRGEEPVVYYEQDGHSTRQSTDRSLEKGTPKITFTIKTSSDFGDVVNDAPSAVRNKLSKADRTHVFDQLVYDYDDKHSTPQGRQQNHRYDPESIIGSNDPFDFGKNTGRDITYFERRDPFSPSDHSKEVTLHDAQEPRHKHFSGEDHYEGITRHEPFGRQEKSSRGTSHDSGGFHHETYPQGDLNDGISGRHQSNILSDPFHFGRPIDDVSRHEPDPLHTDYFLPRQNSKGRVQVLDHIDEDTPTNFYKNSHRYPGDTSIGGDTNLGAPIVEHSSFHSLPVDEPLAQHPKSKYDFSMEPRFQISYERSPERNWGSRRRPPTTTLPRRQRDRRIRPDSDLSQYPRDRNISPNFSNDHVPFSRGQRDRGRSRDRFPVGEPRDRIPSGNPRDRLPARSPRDRIPAQGPRDRIPAQGPRDRRARSRNKEELRERDRTDGGSPGPDEESWKFPDLMGMTFPGNIGAGVRNLFG